MLRVFAFHEYIQICACEDTEFPVKFDESNICDSASRSFKGCLMMNVNILPHQDRDKFRMRAA